MLNFQILLFSAILIVAPVYADSGHEHGDTHSDNEKAEHKDSHGGDHHESDKHGHTDGHEDSHGHSHSPIDKQEAVKKATAKIMQLAADGKIAKTWAKVTMASAEKKTLKNGPEWLITFNNKSVSEKSKQTLYVFYTIEGKYLATNYSGK